MTATEKYVKIRNKSICSGINSQVNNGRVRSNQIISKSTNTTVQKSSTASNSPASKFYISKSTNVSATKYT